MVFVKIMFENQIIVFTATSGLVQGFVYGVRKNNARELNNCVYPYERFGSRFCLWCP